MSDDLALIAENTLLKLSVAIERAKVEVLSSLVERSLTPGADRKQIEETYEQELRAALDRVGASFADVYSHEFGTLIKKQVDAIEISFPWPRAE